MMRRYVALALLLGAACFARATGARAADAKRAIVPEDLFAMQFVSHATISHDGTRVAFIVTRMDLAKDAYLSNIWVAATDGSRVAQLTRGDRDASPDWSPDDRTLAFSRAAGGPPQIYTIELAGGEARKLTDRPAGASAPVWSHDGRRIAFTATTLDAAPPSHVDWKSLGVAAPKNYAKTDIRTLPWPRYEANGAGYTYDKHDHIWTMGRDGSDAKQLTNGADGEQFSAWSADDARIAYGSDALSDPEGDAGTIYTVASNGGAPARVAVARYGAFAPTFTQDGKRVVYSFIGRHDSSGTPGLASADLDGTHDVQAVGDDTVAFGDAVISDTKEGGEGCGVLEPDDRTYVGLISVPGGSEIDAFDLATGRREHIAGGGRELEDCTTDLIGRKVAFTANDATHLSEIYVVDRTDGSERQLTHLNDALTDRLTLATPEAHTVANGQGGTVAYYVLKPPNAVPGKRYPTILDIHGGPETEFGNSFFDEFQVLAARGYTVVYANPRGSVGYGYDWEEGLLGNWGDAMMADETAVMDDVARRQDVDTKHTFVSGGSYGGYATLWVIAHTNRFVAALAERPAVNLFTEALAADFAAPLAFQGAAGTVHAWGPPLKNHDALWQQSPLAHVANVHTPLLLLHGDEDTRTPIAETLQEYEALKILGRRVTLVQVPRENHDFSRTGEPIHRIERLHLMEDWFGRFSR
jgi:dipeptidyl aminopeptidase/acylaminoacyl peptidase